ncbi:MULTISPECIES: hypothetical protein [unclassified Cyanobium]|uniref:hypothetical protein n=1 Tax=unclassified Cyanobium TaxID=2627006 RepID=UPI0020CB8F28|nr:MULTISPECIES: hypothetical protein [unclassified Cyanobium]MCP9777914.1 hypothetical protein [Cyanobium sp. Tous-M-B4]MCP9875587.1 hypothetical protein [Cyanobium sp. A2C-AMD]
MDSGPLARPPKPPFGRERFVFKTLAVVIGTQLLIYSLAAGVCGQRALESRPAGKKKIRSCCSNPPSVPSRWC